MTSSPFLEKSPARILAIFLCALAAWSAIQRAGASDTNAVPNIAQQPVNGIAGIGEDFAFTVVATGTPPLAYQWYFNGAAIAGQPNSTLLLTNLVAAQSGAFYVTVSNPAGSITSSNVALAVQTAVTRRLGTGRVVQSGSTVGVPITLRGSGRESAVSFSMSFDPAVYSAPAFLPANTNAVASLDSSQAGRAGVTVTLPTGMTFPPGHQWIGMLRFNLTGANPLSGALAFATNPVPVAATSVNGLSLTISAAVQPQFVFQESLPTLNLQSGLSEHKILISNPSSAIMTNVDILALRLGTDLQTNAITLFNSAGGLTNAPAGDALISFPCDCACGSTLDAGTTLCDLSGYLSCGSGNCVFDNSLTNVAIPFAQINDLAPGESRLVTLEYYVSDHLAIPRPLYSLFLGAPVVRVPAANAGTLTIDGSRYVNGNFLVEFTTVLGGTYYVQYAATPDLLATAPQTALPAIAGTGSRVQWIDDGPPKTGSPPVNGSRFYSIVRSH